MERKRRSFTPEYKAEVVGLIRDGGKAASSVARDLGLTESAVRRWVLQSETDAYGVFATGSRQSSATMGALNI